MNKDMKESKVVKAYLIISGLLLSLIGGATLTMPVEMKSTAGIDIANNISLTNDVRAVSTLFLAIAVMTLAGAFVKRLTFTSVLGSTVLFTSLGLGRVLSILLDGMPSDGLIKATGLEMVLGLAGIIIFKVFQKQTR